jgi:hypothetical protein
VTQYVTVLSFISLLRFFNEGRFVCVTRHMEDRQYELDVTYGTVLESQTKRLECPVSNLSPRRC